jgi:hypothetical protein
MHVAVPRSRRTPSSTSAQNGIATDWLTIDRTGRDDEHLGNGAE